MTTMQLDMFKELIGENIVILGHHNADPDSIGAAVGVKELLSVINPNSYSTIVMPKDISTLSRNIINILQLEISEKHYDSFDTVIIVDTGNFNQLDVWKEKIRGANSLIVIDHHAKNSDIEELANLYIIDEKASSTSEIMFQLLRSANHLPSEETAKALLAGIIFDSKFLSIGSTSTFESVSRLLEVIGDISEVRAMFSPVYTTSEKIARLKAGQRMKYHRINGWLIALSELGSYQSSGARALITLGADMALVTGSEKKGIRASLRSTNQFYSTTGIQLGELVSQVSHQVEGEGSGHPTAAGFNGNCSPDEFNTKILNKLKELLNN